MIWLYTLAFCRIAIGLVFSISGGSKLLSVTQFQQTITRFRLFPAHLSSVVSFVVIAAEITVVFFLIIGGRLLLIGFLLASVLLLLFCLALISVLARSIQTSCHCFGTINQPVTKGAIYRNIIFIFCALAGSMLVIQRIHIEQLEPMLWLLSGVAALTFVLMTITLGEIVQLLTKPIEPIKH